MAAKKKTAKRAAPRRAAAPAAPRRRRSTALKGVAKIPKLGAAAGILAANASDIAWVAKNSIANPRATFNYVKPAVKKMIQPESLANTAKAALIGYGVGWVAKKFAPKAIKKPVAKIANKVM